MTLIKAKALESHFDASHVILGQNEFVFLTNNILNVWIL